MYPGQGGHRQGTEESHVGAVQSVTIEISHISKDQQLGATWREQVPSSSYKQS